MTINLARKLVGIVVLHFQILCVMTHLDIRNFFLCFARRGALQRAAQFFLRILMLQQYWKRARCFNGIWRMAEATQSSVSDESHIIGGGRTHPLLLDHHRELWTMFTKATCVFGHNHGAVFCAQVILSASRKPITMQKQ